MALNCQAESARWLYYVLETQSELINVAKELRRLEKRRLLRTVAFDGPSFGGARFAKVAKKTAAENSPFVVHQPGRLNGLPAEIPQIKSTEQWYCFLGKLTYSG